MLDWRGSVVGTAADAQGVRNAAGRAGARVAGDGDSEFTARERLALGGAALSALIVELDWLAVSVALPQIADDLRRTPTDLQWVITAFMLGFGGLLPVAGWVTDAFGRRRTTIYAIELFMVSSLVCAMAEDLVWLTVGRALQGAAGGFAVPGAVAMTAGAFSGLKRDRGLAIVLASASGGAALAPFVSGLLVQLFGWRSIFLVNFPLGLAAIALVYWCVRPSNNPETAARRPPLRSGLCVTTGAVALTVLADRGSTWGWASAPAIVCGLWGVGLLVAFVALERDASRAMHGPEVYGDRPLRALTGAGAASMTGFTIVSTFFILYLQEVQGYSAFFAGCVFLGLSVPNALSAYAAGRVPSPGPAYLMVSAALATAAVGVAGLTVGSSTALSVLALAVSGVGIGLSGGLTNVLTQQRVRAEQAGAVSGLALAVKALTAAVALSLAATVLETLGGGGRQASSDQGAIEVVLGAAAAIMLCWALLFLRRAIPVARHGVPPIAAARRR